MCFRYHVKRLNKINLAGSNISFQYLSSVIGSDTDLYGIYHDNKSDTLFNVVTSADTDFYSVKVAGNQDTLNMNNLTSDTSDLYSVRVA